LEIVKEKLFADYLAGLKDLGEYNEEKLKPESICWYPNELAWQLQLTRKDIRRSEKLFRLHNFLIAETKSGNISRQESVSMIPPVSDINSKVCNNYNKYINFRSFLTSRVTISVLTCVLVQEVKLHKLSKHFIQIAMEKCRLVML
jgi:hypothetical protein